MEKEIVKPRRLRFAYRINPRRSMPRHILIKLPKLNTKKEYSKNQGRSNK